MSFDQCMVSVEWLSEHLEDSKLVLLDATWHMPAEQRDGKTEWQQQRIANAQFFDFDREICDQACDLPHMLPDEALFTREAQKLGINNDSDVIVYDSYGVRSSPRVWWMLKTMGHKKIRVLNGGTPAWIRAGLSLNKNRPKPVSKGNFIATLQPDLVKNREQVLAALNNQGVTIVDARSSGRFYAKEPEPRPELRGGHMPGAKCLPYDSLLENGYLLEAKKLSQAFEQCVPQQDGQQLIFSCGSGVTAALLALAAEIVGRSGSAVYDGSWSEWGLPELNLPIDV